RAAVSSPDAPGVRRRRSGPAWLAFQHEGGDHRRLGPVRLLQREPMPPGIVQSEPATNVLETDAGAAAARPGRGLDRAGVLDRDAQRLTAQANVEREVEAVVAPAVLSGVLDQGLQQEARDPPVVRRRFG